MGRWYKWATQSETEMLLGLCLTPLAFTSFRTNFDGTALCPDASESGGGISESTGLSARGKQRVSELIAAGACHASGGLTSAFHGRAAVERGIFRPTYVVLVGLFDGMGTLRRSAERLGLSIAGYVSCEVDPTAKLVIRLR